MQIIGIYFIRSLEGYYIDNFNETLDTQANLLSANLESYLIEENRENMKEEINYLVDHLFALNEVDVSIIDNSGVVITTTEKGNSNIIGQRVYQTEVNRALLGTRDETVKIDDKTGHRTKYLAVPIKRDNHILGAVYLQASMEKTYSTIYRINNILFSATIIALTITAILSFIVSRTITRPIKEITNQTMAMIKGDFNQQVRVYNDDEIGKLGAAFNTLTIRLKEALDQNREEREKLSSILSHMSDGVIATNSLGKIVVVNQRALEILDLERELVLYISIDKILKNLEFPNHDHELIYHYELENENRILKLSFSMIQRMDVGEIGMIVVLQDVTIEQKLERLRKDFVANVSHELRTPLTSIKSYIEALEDGAIEDKQLANRFLKVVSHETDRMIRLVTDLLQLSRLDEKQIRLNKMMVNIKGMIEEVTDRFSFQAKQRSVHLITDIPDYLPTIFMDRDQIDQVLDNLISNAIKYTGNNGVITVTVRLKQEYLFVEVKDTGVGIPKKHLDRLFERFYRVDKGRSREMGGTGLGLSIAREIIKAHQGEIGIESEVGTGTKVSFFIPASAEQEGLS